MSLHLERRAMINAAKNRPCRDCGVQRQHRFMTFDHIPEKGKKNFTIGSISTDSLISLEQLAREISLCEVVCRGCHDIREIKRAKLGIVSSFKKPAKKAKKNKWPPEYDLSIICRPFQALCIALGHDKTLLPKHDDSVLEWNRAIIYLMKKEERARDFSQC